MTTPRCPGQDMRFWKPEDVYDIRCPHCEKDMEFFKDEPFLLCPNCNQEVRNPKIDLGCAKWCKHASECLGKYLESEPATKSACDRLTGKMREIFGKDEKRIQHALAVLDFAEKILACESADPLVVKAAAILHDIGIHAAMEKHGSTAGNFQEIEGPPIARAIMAALNLQTTVIDHVCRIVGSHHSARDIDTPEFRIIWDADWLVNLREEYPDTDPGRRKQLIERIFKTAKGKSLAKEIYLE